ncbi:MAG TPA: hypothetical protein VF322_12785 [Gammaproteobacteria bacterium]
MPRASRAAEPAARSAAPQPSAGSGQPLNAPLFHALIERLDESRRWVVFDLGRARTETIALLGRVRCRLQVVDLVDDAERLNALAADPRELQAAVEALLPRRGEPADAVLCWDLLNYLQRPALTAVMQAVAARGRPGMLAHALIYYSAPRMPMRPGVFVPLPDRRLVDLAPPAAERAAPRYSPEDLGRCMPRYRVERARLLRNGMQEYLLQL